MKMTQKTINLQNLYKNSLKLFKETKKTTQKQ